jgi:hypothetical protein
VLGRLVGRRRRRWEGRPVHAVRSRYTRCTGKAASTSRRPPGREILRFLASEVSPDTFVNVMPQYRPEGLASRFPAIARPLTDCEFRAALAIAREEGLRADDRQSGPNPRDAPA